MQCQLFVWRNICSAPHAYNPSRALLATFDAVQQQRRASSQSLVSLWELQQAGHNSQVPRSGIDESKSVVRKVSRKSQERPVQIDHPSQSAKRARGSQKENVRRPATSVALEIQREDVKDTRRRSSTPSANDQEAATSSWLKQIHAIGALAHQNMSSNRGDLSNARSEQISQRLDYKGIAIEPVSPIGSARLAYPWALDQSHVSTQHALHPVHDVLELEIEHFVEYVKPTSAEKAARRAVVRELESIVHRASSRELRTEIFGSEATGLAFSTSDIDVRIVDKSPVVGTVTPQRPNGEATREAKSPSAKTLMWRVAKLLRQPESNFMCIHHRTGTHHIISGQHVPSGIDIHLVATGDTSHQHASTKRFLVAYPHLQPLYYVLRAALHARSLLDPFNGGLGSYGTFVLLLTSIARLSAASSTPPSLGAQLQEFFSFFSTFDPSKHGLNVHPRAKKFKRHPDSDGLDFNKLSRAALRRQDPVRAGQWLLSRVRSSQPYMLALQDPANPTNNLGKRGNAIKHILATIADMDAKLKAALKEVEAGIWFRSEEGGRARSVLEPLVGRYHEANAAHRRKLEEFGREVLRKEADGIGSKES